MTTDTTPADAQEIEATASEYVTASHDGRDYRVRTPLTWRPSYVRALRQGDFDTWAEGVFHADDLNEWVEADPTFAEIGDFARRVMTDSGEAPGKSITPARSSRSTRRK